MWLADSVIWGPPETSRSWAGEADDDLLQFPWTIERQEVSAVFDRGRLHACKQAAIMLALAGSGPILVPPDEADRHLDISVDGGRRLPASGIAQQADERPVVTAPIADLIHFLEQLGRDAARIRHTALEDGPHDNEISEPHDRFAENRDLRSGSDQPAWQRAARYSAPTGIVVGIDSHHAGNARVVPASHNQRDGGADGNPTQCYLAKIEHV